MAERSLSLQEAAELVGGTLQAADPSLRITGINTLKEASATEASFLANMHYRKDLASTGAAVVLLPDSVTDVPTGLPHIAVRDSYLAFAMLQRHFHPTPAAAGRRHPSAVVDPGARLADDVDVGAGTVIGAGAVIASGTVIGPACVIGAGAVIGERCLLHARAVVAHECVLGNEVILQAGAVIGSDGFGYAWSGHEHLKIPQTGRVVLEDGVEIGANSCIDRGALGDTVIRRGVKLDNLIQIGHNVEVGPFSIMASQVGISGSTKIGAGCQIGGQVGMAGHITIGDGCKLAAKTGVAGDLEAGGTYAGYPAMPHRQWLKMSALLSRLPEMWQRLKNK